MKTFRSIRYLLLAITLIASQGISQTLDGTCWTFETGNAAPRTMACDLGGSLPISINVDLDTLRVKGTGIALAAGIGFGESCNDDDSSLTFGTFVFNPNAGFDGVINIVMIGNINNTVGASGSAEAIAGSGFTFTDSIGSNFDLDAVAAVSTTSTGPSSIKIGLKDVDFTWTTGNVALGISSAGGAWGGGNGPAIIDSGGYQFSHRADGGATVSVGGSFNPFSVRMAHVLIDSKITLFGINLSCIN